MKTDQNTDAKLVKAYLDGDQNAMAELVKRWHLVFCKKAFWLVKDAHVSKDIVQDCWQTIMTKLHTLENPSRFKSWALRIVYSKSLDVLRLQTKKHIREIQIKHSQFVMGNEHNENHELRNALLKAIQRLPAQQQHVIKLFYTENYTLKEISDVLNISVGTAKSRLFHAREKLKLILKDKHYEN